MDAIDPAQHSLVQQSSKEKKKIEKKGKVSSPFSSLVETGQSEMIEFMKSSTGDSLEELLDTVHSAGEALKDHPVFSNIKAYKKAVGDFLRYVVTNSLEAETIEGARISIFKKQKKYIIIKSINDRLDKLAAGILQNQLQQLNILEKVEEIQGMIVDLLS